MSSQQYDFPKVDRGSTVSARVYRRVGCSFAGARVAPDSVRVIGYVSHNLVITTLRYNSLRAMLQRDVKRVNEKDLLSIRAGVWLNLV